MRVRPHFESDKHLSMAKTILVGENFNPILDLAVLGPSAPPPKPARISPHPLDLPHLPPRFHHLIQHLLNHYGADQK